MTRRRGIPSRWPDPADGWFWEALSLVGLLGAVISVLGAWARWWA